MKRMKTKTGAAKETANCSETADRITRRKSVAPSTLSGGVRSSKSSVGNGAEELDDVKSKTVIAIANANKRKSCPAPVRPTTSAATVAAYVTPEKVESIFREEQNSITEEDKREMRRIIMCFARMIKFPSKENSIGHTTFNKILEVLQCHVDNITDDNWSLVLQAIQYSMTPINCGSCFTHLKTLINEILVHKPNYSTTILQVLISKLVRGADPEERKASFFNDNGPSIAELKSFDISIKLICRVIEVMGMRKLNNSLINMMTSSYPYVLKPALTHFYYLKNLLVINKEIGSSMSYCVLSVIFHKLTQLDVLLPRELLDSEELQRMVLPKQEKSATNPTNSSLISQEDGDDLVIEIVKAYGKVASQVEQAQQIATMDISLSYLISFIHSSHENLNFPSLISIFEKEVLPTFNTNCVQFAFFYLINLKEEYMNAFLEALWKKFLNVSTPLVLRIQAAGYIAGVLARSSKSDRRILKRWVSRLTTFAHEYLANRSTTTGTHWSNVNIHAHGPFYAACQAIFYTFAFRHFEIVYGNVPHLKEEEERGKKPTSLPPPKSSSFIYSLNLQRLITSDLNPLKACSSSVAKTFVEVAHAYQISYCKTVLERNNRATIRNMIYENMRDVSSNAEANGVNLLNESFFPFDPLPLTYCKQLVDENFRVYDNHSIALSLVGESMAISKSRRRGESECQDVCDDLDLEISSSDQVDGQDILLVCE